MSLPLILAGKFLNLKIYLFEPNLVLEELINFFKFLRKNFLLHRPNKKFS